MSFFTNRMSNMNSSGQRSDMQNVNQNHGATASIKCTIETDGDADIFSSEIKDRETSTAIDESSFASARLTNNNVSYGEMPNFGEIINEDVKIDMDFGSWAPGIQEYMINGTTIKKIIVRRVMLIKNKIEDIQVTTYGTCLFKTYQQEDKKIRFSFSWVSREDSNIAYDHTGTKIGQYATTYNAATGELKKSGG